MTDTEKALFFASGIRNVKFRYDIIRDGVKYGEADVSSASISFNSDNSICGTARFDIGDNNIDWLSDMIRPVMILKVPQKNTDKFILTWQKFDALNYTVKQLDDFNFTTEQIDNSDFWEDKYIYIEYPLGEYLLSSHDKSITSGIATNSIEAYDKTLILKEDCITDRLYIESGTNYITAIKEIIASATSDDVLSDESTATLPASREFEIGTSKLEIINTLLSEISFEKIYVDLNGIFNLRKFKQPTIDNIDISYKNDELSVICDGMSQTIDYFNVPNVFIATVSNPELDTMKSIYTNDSPVSPLSTVNRGRNIVAKYNVDMVSSQDELDNYVLKKAFEASQIAETVTINTALMPLHSYKNIVALQTDKIEGIFIEQSWSMDLKAGGQMSHNLKRVVTI